MGSHAFDRIMDELTVHPKERVGFHKGDFDSLVGPERQQIQEIILSKLEEGFGDPAPLEWMLGENYVATLHARLASRQPESHGRVFLPYLIYLKTSDPEYVFKMMHAIIAADPAWEGREHALGGYIRKLIGKSPLYWDFCRYIFERTRHIDKAIRDALVGI